MLTHKTTNRVIYGDTDKMGYAYNANYLRWFEIGRSEMFRSMGLSYKTIETRGFFLPVSEVYCKFLAPIQYDDMLVIETSLDTGVKGGMKFDYCIKSEDIKEHALKKRWWNPDRSNFDFALAYSDHENYSRQVSHIRWMRSGQLLQEYSGIDPNKAD